MSQWNQSVDADPKMKTHSHLTRREFRDHIPQVLDAFGVNLRVLDALETHEISDDSMQSQSHGVVDAAKKHGAHRWQQGYSLEEMAREWGHLSLVVLAEIETFVSTQPDLSEAEEAGDSPWSEARRLWAQTVAEGISASAARFDELGRREAEARMRDLEAVLEQVRSFQRERGEILRQVSHDLRGSLTVVKGAASLLESEQIERLEADDLSHLIKVLHTGVNSLSQMMGDLLDLARLEAGRERRVTEQFDVGILLEELGRNMGLLAEEKGLDLRVEGPSTLVVENDRGKVIRIAQNLLLNAIKYTEVGEVTLAWSRLDDEDAHHWELVIADTGYGIQQSAQEPIASELQAVTEEAHEIGASIPPAVETSERPKSSRSASRTRKSSIASGEGVGLSIVKRLCEMLDAVLELESGPGGSKFRIVFPRYYT